MRRRDFILTGLAAAWPITARTQELVRRVGVLLPANANDVEYLARLRAFEQALAQLGWSIASELKIDTRWATTNAADIHKQASELIALKPDVVLAHGAGAVRAFLQVAPNVPIVFPVLGDPVGAGYVASLARPGGNVTGFMNFEFSMGGKWLELLREIAPNLIRVAVLRDTVEGSGTSQFAAIQAVAPSLRVEVRPYSMRDAGEIGRDVEMFAKSPNGGLIVTASAAAAFHRDLIVKLAAQHKLPAVYYDRAFVASGGLLSHGIDYIDQYRKAAGYVDRILKGEKPADLPVQAPTKYITVLNLKTAKALGLAVPQSMLVRADEVIE